MSLDDDLKVDVKKILQSGWSTRDGTVVPTDDSIRLDNDAVRISGTVLYADLADSTKLVDGFQAWFAAEIYKTYLNCAAKIIRSEGGVITAYDGDRIMAVFIGITPNTSAVRSALKINYAMRHIILPAKTEKYPDNTYVPKQVVGVDTSSLFVAKTGVRGANDLVWVGRAANYAAKLSSLNDGDYNTFITKAVYDAMMDTVKVQDGKPMWEQRTWTSMNNMEIYRSNWWWRADYAG